MDFNLSREHQLIRKMMAEFTENEVKPIAAETDKTSQYPRENIEKLFDLGVMGMCVPKEYGGAGADPLASAICIEELSKQCASTGDIVATHNGLCCDPIITHGTEAQKAKYLPMLTTGHHVGAFALTEPNALVDRRHGKHVGTSRIHDLSALNSSMTISIGLDHAAQALTRIQQVLIGSRVATERPAVDLDPGPARQIGFIHD